MKSAFLIACALACVPAFAGTVAVVTSDSWDLYRGSRIVVRDRPSEAACVEAAKSAGPGAYTCRTQTGVAVTVTADPPPAIDCVVSDWSAWTGGDWSACVNGMQSRTEGHSRSVITAPSNGGAACPALTEQRTAAQPCTTPPPTSSTTVLYTDFAAAPIGAPVTICGKGFGSTPSVTVGGLASPVLDAKASLNAGYDCLRVNLPGAGVVTVNGVAGPSIAAQPGDVLYVSLTGNDSTAAKNDPAKPWRHIQTSGSEATAAWGAAKPGDVIVLRGGTWTDSAVDSAFVRIWRQGGSNPMGAKGTGYISITGAPGERVVINAPKGGGFDGGGAEAPQAKYIAISNLTIVSNLSGASDGAPINLQTQGNYWRVVNNDVSWPVAPGGMKAGGIVGHGNGAKLLGNYVHDIAGGTENHGIYLDGGDSIEVGWNTIQRVISGNLFQTYDAWSAPGITNLNAHDNLLEHSGRYGLNLSEGTVSGLLAGNTINDTALAGIRLSVDASRAVNLTLDGNSGAAWNTKGSGSSVGAVNCDWSLTKGAAVIRNGAVTAGSGAKSYYDQQGTCTALKFSGMTWSGLSSRGP